MKPLFSPRLAADSPLRGPRIKYQSFDIEIHINGGRHMAFSLPNLPYPADALEAAIDKTTMEIHHGKHHKAYVDNLNAALEG